MSISSASRITVIIPTFNRNALLTKTLQSLAIQTDAKPFDVVVVDDGSTENTMQVINAFTEKLDISYHFEVDKGYRAARARNVGIRNAKNDLLLFVDTGVLLAPSAVEWHRKCHLSKMSDGERLIVGLAYGMTERSEHELENELRDIIEENSGLGAFEALAQDGRFNDVRAETIGRLKIPFSQSHAPWLLAWSLHLSCSRDAAKKIDGFDENFNSWGCEDIDFSIRMQQAGNLLDVTPSVMAIHYPHKKDSGAQTISFIKVQTYLHEKHKFEETEKLLNGASSVALYRELNKKILSVR